MCKLFCNFAVEMKINWSNIGIWCKKYLLNKYVITILVFVVIYAFVGNQSLLRRAQRSFQIHQLERRLEQYEQGKEETQSELNGLENPDSLARFAREHYYMHNEKEDIYIIPEK